MKKTTIYQVKGHPATTRREELFKALMQEGFCLRTFNQWVGEEIDFEEFLLEYSNYRGDEILELFTEMWKQDLLTIITNNPDFYGVIIVTIGDDE